MASITVPLLGHRIEIVSPEPRVLRLAADAFAAWCQLPRELVSAVPPARFDIDVQGDSGTMQLPTHAEWRRAGSIFDVRVGETRLHIDAAARVASGVTDEAALGDPDWFSWHVLAPARLLATLDDRVPLHAACIADGDRVALVVGQSGSGKSTTAYACHRAGLDVLSEDTVFLSVADGLRIWAHTDTYFLAPDSEQWFPEVASSIVRQRPNGKLRRAVTSGCRPRLSVRADPVVVLLDRSFEAECMRLSTTEWQQYLDRPLESGFDLYEAAWSHARAHVRNCPVFRVGTSGAPMHTAAEIAHLLSRRL